MFYELTSNRDYKSKAEVVAAFNAGKDFQGDYQLGFQTINKPQIAIGSTVLLRYKHNTQVTSVKVTSHALVAEPKAAPKRPSISTMQHWMMDGVAKATDGCEVEPDGTCEHGNPSWLIAEGLI